MFETFIFQGIANDIGMIVLALLDGKKCDFVRRLIMDSGNYNVL